MQNEVSLAMGLRLSAWHGVYCREDDAVAIADLHLGYEAALQAEHVAIPRFQLEPMLERLSALLGRYDPEMLVINGDLKHEFSRNKMQEWEEVEAVLDALEGVDVVVVRGNHDNYLGTILARRGVEMVDSLSLAGGKVAFTHGHKAPESPTGFRVFGHEHPVIRLRDEVGAQMTLPCFLCDERNGFLIMPAFSPLASGTNVISPEAGFMNPALRALDISDARVFAVHGGITDLGRVGDLRELQSDICLGTLKDRNRRT